MKLKELHLCLHTTKLMNKLYFDISDLVNQKRVDLTSLPFTFTRGFWEYIKLKSENGGIFVIKLNDTEYGIPYSVRKGKLLNIGRYYSTPLSLLTGERASSEIESEIYGQFLKRIRSHRMCDRIMPGFNYNISKVIPEGAKGVPFGSYQLDLKNKSCAEILSGMHSKHRNVVRNAEKNNVVIKEGEECFDDFYYIYSETMRRNNMYLESKQELYSFFKSLTSDNCYCAVAYHQNVIQGAVLIPYTKNIACYVFGASSVNQTVNGSVNYLHYKAICYFIAKGVGVYDFVGARLSDVSGTRSEGIQKFKERFGADLFRGYIWKYDINPIKCKIFDKLLYLNAKLRRVNLKGDIIDQEWKKVNHAE